MSDATNTGGVDLLTLENILAYCHNWFCSAERIYRDTFTVADGVLLGAETYLRDGQYYRVVGSVFNDGLHLYRNTESGSADSGDQPDDGGTDANAFAESGAGGGLDGLVDETFSGSVWALAVPPGVVALAGEIKTWQDRYGDMLSSPISSESFGGYSYTKSGAAGTSTGGQTWQDIFASKLSRWRKYG